MSAEKWEPVLDQRPLFCGHQVHILPVNKDHLVENFGAETLCNID